VRGPPRGVRSTVTVFRFSISHGFGLSRQPCFRASHSLYERVLYFILLYLIEGSLMYPDLTYRIVSYFTF
jgi:hypothetical protein